MDSATEKRGKRKKIFKERISLFDHLYQVNPYFNGFYKACKVQLTLFFVYILARDSLQARRFYIDFSMNRLILGGLRDWLVFVGVECTQVFVFLLMYIAFVVWVKLRKWLGKVADFLYLILYILYVCGSFYFVWFVMHQTHVAPIPRLIAFIEQVRLYMKTHSFVRENVYKVLYPWHKDDGFGPAVWYGGQMSPQIASFSQYLYFLFAPTLLYRDHYPRNRGSINWSNVVLYGIQFLCVYEVSRVLFMEIQTPKSMKFDDLLEAYFRCLLCAPLMLFLGCILVFNAWFNFTAELTRFADREFYQNWWSAVGYSEYYRMWNVPIYDFLYTYIFQELRPWMPHRSLASLPAIILSSILHDFFTGVSMGFFAPVFIFLFATIGGIVLISGVKFSKFLTFMFTCIGCFLFQSFFYTEIAARHYCPDDSTGQFDFRTIDCYQKHNNNTVYLH